MNIFFFFTDAKIKLLKGGMIMKKNDNIGTLHSTGETKKGGEDDLQVKKMFKDEGKNKSQKKE